MNEWISVEERLPEEPGRYLSYTDNGEMAVAIRFIGPWTGYWVLPEDIEGVVTHWMPLPEPPEVDDE